MSRSLKKGFFVDPKLMDKVDACQKTGNKKPIQTWSRRSTITPEFVGLNFNSIITKKKEPNIVKKSFDKSFTVNILFIPVSKTKLEFIFP